MNAHTKYMTYGEGGLATALTALAFVSVVIAAKAYAPAYAFHAYLFAAASVAAIFAILNRYFTHTCFVPQIGHGRVPAGGKTARWHKAV